MRKISGKGIGWTECSKCLLNLINESSRTGKLTTTYIRMTIVSAPKGMQFKWVCIFQPDSANVEGTIQKQGTEQFESYA